MPVCAFMGDSIAAGIAHQRPECVSVVRIGITSHDYMRTLFRPLRADTIVISLGVNDDPVAHTRDNLRSLRASVQASRVIWMLPGIKPRVREAIRAVAAAYGDRLIDIGKFAGPDHLHPTGAGYKSLAVMTGGAAFTDVKRTEVMMRNAHDSDQAHFEQSAIAAH